MTYVQERVLTAAGTLPSSAPLERLNQAGFGTARFTPIGKGDAIRRTGPQHRFPPDGVTPQPLDTAGGMSGIVSQLLNVVQQLLSMIGLGGLFGTPQQPETYFQNASGSSTGDPHLAFDGTSGSGAIQQAHFDSMIGHADLLNSDSFAGGFQISTKVTQPGSNGVTYNQRASVSTNFGQTQVSLDKDGEAAIVQNGQSIPLMNGSSYDLGDGETVTRNSDGSVVVRDDNAMGGTISTTLRENGQGVDVNTQAVNVDLGGDLFSQPQPRATPLQRPA